MSNRITEAEYAHYALTYAAAKMSAPLPPHGSHREAVLSALAVDDAKGVLGVLPCMSSEEGPLVDLQKVDLNGAQIMTLYCPRGYNVQEILDGARAMAKSSHMQGIDSVSAHLHAALGGVSKDYKPASDSDNLKEIRSCIEEIALKAVARAHRRAVEER